MIRVANVSREFVHKDADTFEVSEGILHVYKGTETVAVYRDWSSVWKDDSHTPTTSLA